METADVAKIAEAVLYEGYLLFPYRRSAMKNQQRWTFGGVYPRQYSEASGGDDPWLMQTQCLVVGNADTRLEINARFLQVVERKVGEKTAGSLRFVEELRVDGQVYRPWEEAKERDFRVSAAGGGPLLCLGDLLMTARTFAIEVPAGSENETLWRQDGIEAGTLVREWRFLQGAVEITVELLETHTPQDKTRMPGESVYRLTVRITNTTPWPEQDMEACSRNEAARQAFISTHTILRVQNGEFISLLEPPDSYQQAADECQNIKTWPVLVGETGERHTLLSSPIILYDYPQISPESQGNYFDATEIDELLALSIMTLTDEEKQEMRESDIHAKEILARTEALSEEQLLKMHGVVRYLQPMRRKAE